jgi:recombinational DNA repair protein (RecF pathway)
VIRYSFSLQSGGIFCGRCARQTRKRKKEKKSQYGKGIGNRREGEKRETKEKRERSIPMLASLLSQD